MNEDGNKLPDRGVYHGNSMGDIFTDGDLLIFEEVPFDKLECGDIVAVFERTPYYVHRIVKKENGSAITMDDNNLTPDELELNKDSKFRFVKNYIHVETASAVLAVTGGAGGMEQFLRRQKQLSMKRRMIGILSPLRPLKFLRIPARKETRFRDGTIQWNFGGIPVAARPPAGKVKYLSSWKRLFFRIPVRPTPTAESRNNADRLAPKRINEP
jgi:hypothetical protein